MQRIYFTEPAIKKDVKLFLDYYLNFFICLLYSLNFFEEKK